MPSCLVAIVPIVALPSTFVHICVDAKMTKHQKNMFVRTKETKRQTTIGTSENIQLRWREKTHFYSSGSYEIGMQGFGEMERFHLTFVGVRKNR